jgi:hypothetical protein
LRRVRRVLFRDLDSTAAHFSPPPNQAAKLLSMFRELKRRQAVGLGPFYGRKLAALEDALLAAREALFAAQDLEKGGGCSGGGGGGDSSGGVGGSSVAEQRRASRGAAVEGAAASPQRQQQRRQQGARAGAAAEDRVGRDQGGGSGDACDGGEKDSKVGALRGDVLWCVCVCALLALTSISSAAPHKRPVKDVDSQAPTLPLSAGVSRLTEQPTHHLKA